MIPAIVRVLLDEGEIRTVPLTPETTARDVIDCCRDPEEPFCTLVHKRSNYERALGLEERPLHLLQDGDEGVVFILRYDMTQDVREDTEESDNGMKGPHPASGQLPDGVELTLAELREMASRQQRQIDQHQQQLAAREQRLRYLKQQESRQQAMSSETERLRRLRERVEAQEQKLRKLRALRGQSDQQRVNNNALSVDLENIRALFNEKEKELSLAVARVEEMTKQLEEVRRGRQLKHGPQGETHQELEKLRRELMYRNKLNEQQQTQLSGQRELISQRRDEMARIDQRIAELQQRLQRKRQHNQQLAQQLHASAAKRPVRQAKPAPPAGVALRAKDDAADLVIGKGDVRYQTLPFGTKFGALSSDGFGQKMALEAETQMKAALPAPGTRAPPLGGAQNPTFHGSSIPTPHAPEAITNFQEPTLGKQATGNIPGGPVRGTVPLSSVPSASVPSQPAADSSQVLADGGASGSEERPLLPPKPAGPAAAGAGAVRGWHNGDSTGLVGGARGDVSQVSVRGLPAKPNGQPFRYASHSQIASTYTQQSRPEPRPSSQPVPQRLEPAAEPDALLPPPQAEGDPQVRVSINSRIEMPPAYMFPQLRGDVTDSRDDVTVDKNDNRPGTDEVDRAPVKREPVLDNSDVMMTSRQKEPTSQESAVAATDVNSNTKADTEEVSDSPSTSSDMSATDGEREGDPGSEVSAVRRRKASSLKTPGGPAAAKTRRVSFDPLALLLDASLEGELELVMRTAGQVSNPSASNDEGITALHNAICAGHFEIVKFLVEFGCDVNAQDSDGWTPLHCAASCNNQPMVRFLVEHGACIFATTLSDHETAAEKCEEDEEGYHGCSEYLYSIQEKLGILNGGRVYAVFSYTAENEDELSLEDGLELTVIRKGDEVEREWWWATAPSHAPSEGYVPRNLLGLYPRVKPRASQQPEGA